jgi:uncharacterized damage-inducible protein DinB
VKRRILLQSFGALAATTLSPVTLAFNNVPEDAFLNDFLDRWETSRQYMIDVAQKMPESDYGFKPTSEQTSFGEQLMHIAAVIDWHGFAKADGQEFKPRWTDYKVDGLSKQQIISVLESEFERVTELITDFDPSRLDETSTYGKFTRTRRQFFMLMADHVTHHRAQLLVYLRLKGIMPPKYWEFQ